MKVYRSNITVTVKDINNKILETIRSVDGKKTFKKTILNGSLFAILLSAPGCKALTKNVEENYQPALVKEYNQSDKIGFIPTINVEENNTLMGPEITDNTSLETTIIDESIVPQEQVVPQEQEIQTEDNITLEQIENLEERYEITGYRLGNESADLGITYDEAIEGKIDFEIINVADGDFENLGKMEMGGAINVPLDGEYLAVVYVDGVPMYKTPVLKNLYNLSDGRGISIDELEEVGELTGYLLDDETADIGYYQDGLSKNAKFIVYEITENGDILVGENELNGKVSIPTKGSYYALIVDNDVVIGKTAILNDFTNLNEKKSVDVQEVEEKYELNGYLMTDGSAMIHVISRNEKLKNLIYEVYRQTEAGDEFVTINSIQSPSNIPILGSYFAVIKDGEDIIGKTNIITDLEKLPSETSENVGLDNVIENFELNGYILHDEQGEELITISIASDGHTIHNNDLTYDLYRKEGDNLVKIFNNQPIDYSFEAKDNVEYVAYVYFKGYLVGRTQVLTDVNRILVQMGEPVSIDNENTR